MLTGKILERYERHILEPADLIEWATKLLIEGHDSDAIRIVAGLADMHWEEMRRFVAVICKDLGLSDDVDGNIESVMRNVWVDEYRQGLRSGASVLQRFDDIRKRVGFPEMVIHRTVPDNPDGTNDSGFYGSKSGVHGVALEKMIRERLDLMSSEQPKPTQ